MIARADLYDSGKLRSSAQLKGRKFALNAKGTVLDYALAKLLARDGLKLSDLDMVTMPFPEMMAAFGNKSLDAAIMLEPTATTALNKGVGRLLTGDLMPDGQLAMVAGNAKFVAEHGAAVQRFLRSYIETVRRFDDGGLKGDDQALSILQKYTGVPAEIIRQVPDTYWPKDGRLNLASLEDQQEYYLQNKSVDYTEPIPLSKFIDYSYLDLASGK